MKPKLNIFEMLCGDMVRLRYVKRFSTCRVLNPESVAEHCYFTSLYCMFVADWVQASNKKLKINYRKLYSRALLHDLEEARTGDMPRYAKHDHEKLTARLAFLGRNSLGLMLSDRVVDRQESERLRDLWAVCKDGSTEGLILAFCDYLSVLGYVTEEVRASNRTMHEHLISMREYADSFKDEKYDFIRPLVDQTEEIIAREGILA